MLYTIKNIDIDLTDTQDDINKAVWRAKEAKQPCKSNKHKLITIQIIATLFGSPISWETHEKTKEITHGLQISYQERFDCKLFKESTRKI